MKFWAILLFFFPLLTFGQSWRDTLNLAREAYKSKAYDKAISYYRSAQNSAPEGVDLSKEMAQANYRSQDYKSSDQFYNQSIDAAQTPKEKAELQHNLGNSRMKQKDYAGAIEAYKESLRNNPGDEQTRYNLSEAIRQKKNQDQKQQQQNNSSNQPKDNTNSGDNQQKKNDSPPLPNKQADKMLDDLAKKEAAARRNRGNQKKGDQKQVNSGKNW